MSATQSHSLANTLIGSVSQQKSATRLLWQVLAVACGVALITLSARVQVPLWPNPTPVTLQTLVIFTLAAAYGSRLGVATLLTYMGLGAIGYPVFAGTPEKGLGVIYMMGATGGYLAGFVIMSWITGKAADRGFGSNPLKMASAMLVGEAIMLTLGALWMGYLFGSEKIIAWGVGPFILSDLIKLALAAGLVSALYSLIARLSKLAR